MPLHRQCQARLPAAKPSLTALTGAFRPRRVLLVLLICFMRTTIDMPTTLMRAAKARAAEQGESLKDLVNRAVAHEVGLPSVPKGKTGRVTLPLIARDATPTVLVTSDDIEDAFGAEDAERYGGQ